MTYRVRILDKLWIECDTPEEAMALSDALVGADDRVRHVHQVAAPTDDELRPMRTDDAAKVPDEDEDEGDLDWSADDGDPLHPTTRYWERERTRAPTIWEARRVLRSFLSDVGPAMLDTVIEKTNLTREEAERAANYIWFDRAPGGEIVHGTTLSHANGGDAVLAVYSDRAADWLAKHPGGITRRKLLLELGLPMSRYAIFDDKRFVVSEVDQKVRLATEPQPEWEDYADEVSEEPAAPTKVAETAPPAPAQKFEPLRRSKPSSEPAAGTKTAAVLAYIRTHGPLRTFYIAKQLGFHQGSVGGIVTDLYARRFVDIDDENCYFAVTAAGEPWPVEESCAAEPILSVADSLATAELPERDPEQEYFDAPEPPPPKLLPASNAPHHAVEQNGTPPSDATLTRGRQAVYAELSLHAPQGFEQLAKQMSWQDKFLAAVLDCDKFEFTSAGYRIAS